MSNEEIKRAILEMDEREELAKDMLEQVSAAGRPAGRRSCRSFSVFNVFWCCCSC